MDEASTTHGITLRTRYPPSIWTQSPSADFVPSALALLAGREGGADEADELDDPAVAELVESPPPVDELPNRPSVRPPPTTDDREGGSILLSVELDGAEDESETTSCSFLASPRDEITVVDGELNGSGLGG